MNEIRESGHASHEFYRDGGWQLCRGCDYLEPIGMVYLAARDAS